MLREHTGGKRAAKMQDFHLFTSVASLRGCDWSRRCFTGAARHCRAEKQEVNDPVSVLPSRCSDEEPLPSSLLLIFHLFRCQT